MASRLLLIMTRNGLRIRGADDALRLDSGALFRLDDGNLLILDK